MRKLLAALALLMFPASYGQAAPNAIPYVGFLTFEAGAPYSGAVDISTQIFSADAGGVSLWGPFDFQAVPVQSGVFTLLLGGPSTGDLGPALDSGQPLWLAFSVDGVALSPRQQILSVPFSMRATLAQNAGALGGLPASAYALNSALSDAAVSGSFNDLEDVPANLATANGEVGQLAQFVGPQHLGPSAVVQVEDRVGVGVAAPAAALHVAGAVIVGSDAGECNAARAGALRWTGTALEVCNGAVWSGIGSAAAGFGASGGAVTQFTGNGQNGEAGRTYRVHTFTASGSFQVTSAPANAAVEYLVAGGGGGGGVPYGGGGGGGGVRSGTTPIGVGSYNVVVGAGGAGRLQSAAAQTGGAGGGSSFGVFSATVGGGGGGAWNSDSPLAGLQGGSGGGGGPRNSDTNGQSGGAGVAGEGFAGGNGRQYSNGGGGGGGGASGAGGTSGSVFVSGAGGPGVVSSISGTAVTYGSGGAGGIGHSTGTFSSGAVTSGGGLGGYSAGGVLMANGQNGAANTGGGGGGAGGIGQGFGGSGNSGAGGSGVVIIRYPID